MSDVLAVHGASKLDRADEALRAPFHPRQELAEQMLHAEVHEAVRLLGEGGPAAGFPDSTDVIRSLHATEALLRSMASGEPQTV